MRARAIPTPAKRRPSISAGRTASPNPNFAPFTSCTTTLCAIWSSSLSAYLRSYLIINLVSVEQLSYSEFLECLPSPTCIIALGLRPYDGNAVLEMNSSLIFPILEILLGGDGKTLDQSAARDHRD